MFYLVYKVVNTFCFFLGRLIFTELHQIFGIAPLLLGCQDHTRIKNFADLLKPRSLLWSVTREMNLYRQAHNISIFLLYCSFKRKCHQFLGKSELGFAGLPFSGAPDDRPTFFPKETLVHKVHIFWEGHKILRNLPLTFDYSTYSQK